MKACVFIHSADSLTRWCTAKTNPGRVYTLFLTKVASHGLGKAVCSKEACRGGLRNDAQPYSRGDLQARGRVQARIERLAAGNPGEVEPVGEGVSELRINYGPGYRVYFKKPGRELIILLAGGDKATQVKDIKAALRLARNLSE